MKEELRNKDDEIRQPVDDTMDAHGLPYTCCRIGNQFHPLMLCNHLIWLCSVSI